MRGSEETAVLLSEDDGERVEPVPGEDIELTVPVRLIPYAAFPVGTVHRVEGPLGRRRPHGRVPYLAEGIARIGIPRHALGDLEEPVHEAAVVRSADQERRPSTIPHATDEKRLRSAGKRRGG